MDRQSDFTPAGRCRVAITGAGIITSMGVGCAANAEGFRVGRLALKKITLFDASRQRVDRAGEVDLPEKLPSTCLTAAQHRRVERGSALMIHAAAEAWAEAGYSPQSTFSKPVPLCLGTSAGAMAVGEAYFKQAVQAPADHRQQARRVQQYQIHNQAQLVADAFALKGRVTVISNACASGANSIGHALEEIRAGRADVAVCGGYDAIAEMVFAGFDSLQALSTDLPRPFDANRDGLALGEGAGAFVLESYAHAQARGATILAELCGYGAATDLHHLTQPHPQGDAALASMQAACSDAEIQPQQVGYINSHGTGTPLNDVAEANAIVRWANNPKIAVSSTKGCIGHLLGGAGSVEAVICLLALRGGWLPPSPSIRTLDPACQFDVILAPRDQQVDFCLTNSFGFGGANATLILGKPDRVQGTFFATASQPASSIVIKGLGAVSPAGWGMQALLGSEEIIPVTQIRTVGALPVVQRSVPAPAAPLAFAREPRVRRVSPIGRFLTAAALEAMAGNTAKPADFRLGIVFTVFNGCVNYSRRFYTEVLNDPKTASPILFPETVFNAPASHLSSLLASPGINYTLVGGQDCFLDGLEIAKNWLLDGKADGVLVAAAEELDWLSGEASALLSPGVIVAEGAAAVYLECGEPGDTSFGQMPANSSQRRLGNGLGASAGWDFLLNAGTR